MPAQTQVLTERQLELLTKAAQESDGLLSRICISGGVKVRMIDFFAARGLIVQVGGQWRLTPSAYSVVQGQANLASIDGDSLARCGCARFRNWPACCRSVLASGPDKNDGSARQARGQSDAGGQAGSGHRDAETPRGAACRADLRGDIVAIAHNTWILCRDDQEEARPNYRLEKITGPAGAPGAGQRLYRITDAVAA